MKPFCAKCKKPVANFYVERSMYCFEDTYIAVCHGETDRMVVTGEMQFMLRTGNDSIIEFVAFREKEVKDIG